MIWAWAAPAIALFVQSIIFWYKYRKLNDDAFIGTSIRSPIDQERMTHANTHGRIANDGPSDEKKTAVQETAAEDAAPPYDTIEEKRD